MLTLSKLLVNSTFVNNVSNPIMTATPPKVFNTATPTIFPSLFRPLNNGSPYFPRALIWMASDGTAVSKARKPSAGSRKNSKRITKRPQNSTVNGGCDSRRMYQLRVKKRRLREVVVEERRGTARSVVMGIDRNAPIVK